MLCVLCNTLVSTLALNQNSEPEWNRNNNFLRENKIGEETAKSLQIFEMHFEDVKEVVSQLDPEDAVSIGKAQLLFESNQLQLDLAFIRANICFLPKQLKKLETKGLALAESFAIMDKVQDELNNVPGQKGAAFVAKFKAVLARNPDVNVLRAISSCLSGSEGCELPESVRISDLPNFKFCPTASVDVERSFSVYKGVLTDKRHRLTQENIRKIMVTHCYLNQ